MREDSRKETKYNARKMLIWTIVGDNELMNIAKYIYLPTRYGVVGQTDVSHLQSTIPQGEVEQRSAGRLTIKVVHSSLCV